jgi:pentatricopeptide repeat domain-containing protein 1
MLSSQTMPIRQQIPQRLVMHGMLVFVGVLVALAATQQIGLNFLPWWLNDFIPSNEHELVWWEVIAVPVFFVLTLYMWPQKLGKRGKAVKSMPKMPPVERSSRAAAPKQSQVQHDSTVGSSTRTPYRRKDFSESAAAAAPDLSRDDHSDAFMDAKQLELKDRTKRIQNCIKSGSWERAISLLEKMRVAGISPDKVSFSAAISACEKSGQWKQAMALMREMRLEGVAPDTITYNAVISACGKGSEWALALKLFRLMNGDGIEADRITFNACISACARGMQWQMAMQLLEEMKSTENCTPDTVSYGSTLHACEKGKAWKQALEVLRDMQENQVPGNNITFNSAVRACASTVAWAEAIELIEEMKSAGLQPDSCTYKFGLTACRKGSKWREALKYLEELRVVAEAEKVKPELLTYCNVIQACCKAHQFKEALETMEGMKAEGIYPDQYTCNLLVQALEQSSMWEMAYTVKKWNANGSLDMEKTRMTQHSTHAARW